MVGKSRCSGQNIEPIRHLEIRQQRSHKGLAQTWVNPNRCQWQLKQGPGDPAVLDEADVYQAPKEGP